MCVGGQAKEHSATKTAHRCMFPITQQLYFLDSADFSNYRVTALCSNHSLSLNSLLLF